MNKKGFTLIELLIVIAIIAIIAGMVFVALNPLQRFKDARDSRRWGDVSSILSAVKINQVDKKGLYIPEIEAMPVDTGQVIGTAPAGCACGNLGVLGCVNLSNLATGGYLASVPLDPKNGTAANTGYYLVKMSNGTIRVGACAPEAAGAIEASR